MNELISEAIQKAGGAAALANSLGLQRTAVTNWKMRGRIPAEHCRDIERITGISRHELRPDVFGPTGECAA